MKKYFFCTLFLMGIFLASPVFGASFTDVPENSKYYDAVEYLKDRNIISGYSDKTFKPENSINRAEAVKILLLAAKPFLGDVPVLQNNISFQDVKTQDWFYDVVREAAAYKLIQGYSDGTFKPANTINLAESMKVVLTAMKAELSQNVAASPYPDVDQHSWYAALALYGKQKNLLDPQSDGKLHPERNMTRGDFAEIMYRLLYIKESQLEKFPLYLHWPLQKSSAYYSIHYPLDWKAVSAQGEYIFWKKDEANGQISFSRVFPNSGTVIMAMDQNPQHLSLDQYLAKILYDKSAVIEKKTINQYPVVTVTLTASGIKDFYLELPNKTIVAAYTQVGGGVLQDYHKNLIENMIDSIRYDEQAIPQTNEEILAKIREKILVEGAGKLVLGLLEDEILFETDTIGIGTGPVDYYFSQILNTSFKYERNSDTLLSIKEGKTSAF